MYCQYEFLLTNRNSGWGISHSFQIIQHFEGFASKDLRFGLLFVSPVQNVGRSCSVRDWNGFEQFHHSVSSR